MRRETHPSFPAGHAAVSGACSTVLKAFFVDIPVLEGAYRIGAVARLTGFSPDTLRIWERRYDIVEPQRTPKGGRLYSQQDVTRLTMIKTLVDQAFDGAFGPLMHFLLEDKTLSKADKDQLRQMIETVEQKERKGATHD